VALPQAHCAPPRAEGSCCMAITLRRTGRASEWRVHGYGCLEKDAFAIHITGTRKGACVLPSGAAVPEATGRSRRTRIATSWRLVTTTPASGISNTSPTTRRTTAYSGHGCDTSCWLERRERRRSITGGPRREAATSGQEARQSPSPTNPVRVPEVPTWTLRRGPRREAAQPRSYGHSRAGGRFRAGRKENRPTSRRSSLRTRPVPH
jgi:hypothetical protein